MEYFRAAINIQPENGSRVAVIDQYAPFRCLLRGKARRAQQQQDEYKDHFSHS
jgi:hypothetical protein